MHPLHRQSISDQTAAHLRDGVRSGRWGLRLPGVVRLAAELQVSKDAVRAALRRLEAEGAVQPGGNGRRRVVAAPHASQTGAPPRAFRVGILLSRPLHHEAGNGQHMELRLLHEIEASGHSGFFAPMTQACVGHRLPRIARVIKEGKADAWVVVDAPEELMRWFSTQPVPAVALGGRYCDAPLARVGMELTPGIIAAVRALKQLGHRRIVLAVPRVWRLPEPGRLVRAVLDELGGAPEYHAPDWEPGARGFHELLESLFRVTPPTAMIVLEPAEAVAVMSFLAQRGLRVPRDLSLVCRNHDASLALCRPEIAHCGSNEDHLVGHIVKWVNDAARGTPHQRRIVCQPEFFPCESLAPPATR